MNEQTKAIALWSGTAVAVIALASATFGLSVPNLRRHAQAAVGERVEVSFVDVPSWMTPTDLAPIQDLVAREAGTSAYDRDGLARAQIALAACGWFDEVRQVRRVTTTSLEVDATFVDPVALVVDRDGEHLLDSRARLMPRTYAAGTAPKLTRILGASLPRPTKPGQVWGGADLRAGIEMAKIVGMQRWRGQVDAVDVSEFATKQTLALMTTRQCKLIWGRAPGSGASAEVPAAQKLRYLDMLTSQYGRIDGAGPQSIDLSVDYVGSH